MYIYSNLRLETACIKYGMERESSDHDTRRPRHETFFHVPLHKLLYEAGFDCVGVLRPRSVRWEHNEKRRAPLRTRDTKHESGHNEVIKGHPSRTTARKKVSAWQVKRVHAIRIQPRIRNMIT